jgi:hypothetical protein
MKSGAVKLSWGMLAAVVVASPAISYFKYQRPIQATNAGGQHYAVVDAILWHHTRAGLRKRSRSLCASCNREWRIRRHNFCSI